MTSLLYCAGLMSNSRCCYASIAIFLVFCSALTSLVAQDQKTITALYIDGPIAIDGNLDEPEWDLAQPGGDFIQNEPRTGEPATEPTEVRLLYDDDNLYIGVYCFDSAGEDGITVTEVKRDYRPCLLYTSPSPRDGLLSRMPSSA